MHARRKSILLFGAALAALVLACLAVNPEACGRFLWKYFRLAPLALYLDPDSSLAFAIGEHYFNADGSGVYNLDAAEAYFKRSLVLDPQAPAAWHEIARIEFLRGNFASALAAIDKQISLHGDETVASYYVRALIEGFMKNNDAAEADFSVFLAAKPGNWGVYNDLAWIYFQEGEYGKAEAIARKGLKIAPESPWLLTSLGVSLFNEGKNTEAAAVLAHARTQLATLSAGDWGRVNPGNDPRIAASSLEKMKEAIEKDLALIPAAR